MIGRVVRSLTPRPPLHADARNEGVLFASLLFAVVACKPAPSPTAQQLDGHANLRGEVQAFYSWYLSGPPTGRSIDDVLRERPQVLSTELRSLLEKDRKCSADSHAICNLDFDPFWAGQDTCGPFVVGPGMTRGDTMEFQVTSVCTGTSDTAVRISAVVVAQDSGWVFANLRYPRDGSDILSILRQPEGK